MTALPILAATKTEPTQPAPRVAAPQGTANAAPDGFGLAFDRVRVDAGSASAGENGPTAPLRPLVVHEARSVPPLEQFEGFVLRSFVESMLPSEASSYFGAGTAGAMWRSMMAEEIGNELARGGGIGIAAQIAGERTGDYGATDGRDAAGDGLNRMLRQNDLTRATTLRDDSAK